MHAVKSAVIDKLDLEEFSMKAVQKVKSGIAIVPSNEKQANQLLEKSQVITALLGGKIEKDEEWQTCVVDHVPRNLCSLDSSRWEITPERAQEEIQSITGATPVRVAWTRKSLENSAPTGSIVASFLHTVRPFRLFGSSSVSHQIVKTPRPTQFPKR